MFFQVEGKKGNYRNIARLSWMAPLWQDHNRLLFADMRFMMDNQKDREGNIGLGYRQIMRDWGAFSDGVILGGYLFYDRRRSTFKNYFNQLVIGAEALGEYFQVRGNYYRPNNRTYQLDPKVTLSNTRAGWDIVDNRMAITYSSLVDIQTDTERSLIGYDCEARAKLPIMQDIYLWAGAGYYRFHRDSIKQQGPTAMVDLELCDGLGIPGSRASIGFEYRSSRGGKSNKYGVIKLSSPIGKSSEVLASKLYGIDYEMTRFIERDVDIPTGTTSLSKQVNASGEASLEAVGGIQILSGDNLDQQWVQAMVQAVQNAEQARPFCLLIGGVDGNTDVELSESVLASAVSALEALPRSEERDRAISLLEQGRIPFESTQSKILFVSAANPYSSTSFSEVVQEALGASDEEGVLEKIRELMVTTGLDAEESAAVNRLITDSEALLSKNANPVVKSPTLLAFRKPLNYESYEGGAIEIPGVTLGLTASSPAFYSESEILAFPDQIEVTIENPTTQGSIFEITPNTLQSLAGQSSIQVAGSGGVALGDDATLFSNSASFGGGFSPQDLPDAIPAISVNGEDVKSSSVELLSLSFDAGSLTDSSNESSDILSGYEIGISLTNFNANETSTPLFDFVRSAAEKVVSYGGITASLSLNNGEKIHLPEGFDESDVHQGLINNFLKPLIANQEEADAIRTLIGFENYSAAAAAVHLNNFLKIYPDALTTFNTIPGASGEDPNALQALFNVQPSNVSIDDLILGASSEGLKPYYTIFAQGVSSTTGFPLSEQLFTTGDISQVATLYGTTKKTGLTPPETSLVELAKLSDANQKQRLFPFILAQVDAEGNTGLDNLFSRMGESVSTFSSNIADFTSAWIDPDSSGDGMADDAYMEAFENCVARVGYNAFQYSSASGDGYKALAAAIASNTDDPFLRSAAQSIANGEAGVGDVDEIAEAVEDAIALGASSKMMEAFNSLVNEEGRLDALKFMAGGLTGQGLSEEDYVTVRQNFQQSLDLAPGAVTKPQQELWALFDQMATYLNNQ